MCSQEDYYSKNKRKADELPDFTKDPDLENYEGWASGVSRCQFSLIFF